jgi:predicted hydrocarbon binding protein/KaiC/GvpD/RAD55 family RecA-like ATPase
LILLVGPPGSGKSTFCEQTILRNLAIDRPIIYVTTGYDSSKAEERLREKGLGSSKPDLLKFIDAYSRTVGVSFPDKPNVRCADCNNLSSIDIAISNQYLDFDGDDVLLVFNSLTSPYLFNGAEIFRFMTQTLSRFVAEGNSVIACIDEGCGKLEDLISLQSLSNGVIKIEKEQDKRVFTILKHPKVQPTRINVSTEDMGIKLVDIKTWDREIVKHIIMEGNYQARKFSVGLGVNILWPNLARWSSISWNPEQLPEITYKFSVEWAAYIREMISMLPWHTKFLSKVLVPNGFSKVKDMKKLFNRMLNPRFIVPKRYGLVEYLEEASKTDEHHFRIHESFECCGLENVGTTLALSSLYIPGILKGLEKKEREWNAIETKCIGLGDPYCELKVVPGEIPELESSLQKHSSMTERIQARLVDQLIGFMVKEQPPAQRPKLGNDLFLGGEISALAMAREKYRMAMRMGGVKIGREVGKRLADIGLGEDEAVKKFLNLLEYFNVGKVTYGKTLEIENSCESFWTNFYRTKWKEPCCFFTTGFLNGLFSAVKNQHVKETKCIAMGDPYCEWEFR